VILLLHLLTNNYQQANNVSNIIKDTVRNTMLYHKRKGSVPCVSIQDIGKTTLSYYIGINFHLAELLMDGDQVRNFSHCKLVI